MKNDDLNFIVKLEKAISDRWGAEAIENPKKHWTPEKEKKHTEEVKKFYKRKFFRDSKNSKEKYKGFLISKKLLNKEPRKNCPVCGAFPKKSMDDVCLVKFECCYKCFIQYVEGREERWIKGWRPNDLDKR